jgi:hypothetical protein
MGRAGVGGGRGRPSEASPIPGDDLGTGGGPNRRVAARPRWDIRILETAARPPKMGS